MDDKPPQGQPPSPLPEWMPIQSYIFLVVFVLTLFVPGGWRVLFGLIALVLLIWSLISVAEAEKAPASFRERLSWLLPIRATLLRWLQEQLKQLTAPSPPRGRPPLLKDAKRLRGTELHGIEVFRSIVIGGAFIALGLGLGSVKYASSFWVWQWLSIPLIVLGILIALTPIPILSRDYIMQEWSTLIVPGASLAETFMAQVEATYASLQLTDLHGRERLVAPTAAKRFMHIFLSADTVRPFFVLSPGEWALTPYHIYIGAHPYGTTLQAVCYVTMAVGIFRRLLALIPLVGRLAKITIKEGFIEPDLDTFEKQDLTAYSTVGRFLWQQAVDHTTLALNQQPKEQKIHYKGFLGIEA